MSVNQYPGTPVAPVAPPAKRSSALGIVGLVLAIFIPPIGFILSLIALIRGNGRVFATIGLIISLILNGIIGVAVYAGAKAVDEVTDPACSAAVDAINNNYNKLPDTASADALKTALQATISGLKDAQSKAKHDELRTTVGNLTDDYQALLDAANNQTDPSQSVQDKRSHDIDALNQFCTGSTTQN
jgi:hypothetical protein